MSGTEPTMAVDRLEHRTGNRNRFPESPMPGNKERERPSCVRRDARLSGEPEPEAGVAAANPSLEALRRKVAHIEGAPVARLEEKEREPGGSDRSKRTVALQVPAFDEILGGGLKPGLTEIRLRETREAGAGLGLALAIGVLARARVGRPLLWIGESLVFGEAGGACRTGIGGFGLDPAALVLVETRRLEEAVWAGEEAARSSAAALVVLEIRGNPRLLALEGTRRLHLRAQRSGIVCLLLRQAAEPEPTAAPFRLLVEPAPSLNGTEEQRGATRRLLGPPAFRVTVEKSADGRERQFTLEWNSDEHRFQTRSLPLSGAMVPVVGDRPDPALGGGRIMALRYGRPADGSCSAGQAERRRA